ncbi:arabinose-5-phosphate isomerase [Luteitalea sp. TBR-22]|uniref:KpsF/GutQ family sugar-phosphate isomerase n=1 Tax=Luteitalea sp. TBR-22 TaxID=2802971 RepID=UPI001AF63B8F|nr:KpsF/GutQ family sugar-phosphate isomerase [Luteitalea sp. TBR-22]BCS33843.1 arabinose-5-phosphate isomerase [Luteitalea sp. TBR-22]
MTAIPESGASTHRSLDLAARVLRIEANAVEGLVARLDGRFIDAVRLLAACRGRVIVTGMGKSGLICRKIAATLASTGTPAFFLHPAEALHGDLGVVTEGDVVVALSYGGETAEVVRLVEIVKRLGARLIGMTGAPQSTLAQLADVHLDCGVDEEACPLNLAPTASTTAALALGDALAMVLLTEKGFRADDFAYRHPGGSLGKRLMRVSQLMHAGETMPSVPEATPLREVIYEMSRKGLGMTCVVDEAGRLVGIITDGDLRRLMMREADVARRTAREIMTPRPVTIAGDVLAAEALQVMEARRITSVPVVGADGRPTGVLHIHDLWRTELF